jgi:hypothetical protein
MNKSTRAQADSSPGTSETEQYDVQNADEPSNVPMVLQPETRPIAHDQLVAEVKGIYAGLIMVETKCAEVDGTQAATKPSDKLSNEQWQVLIALHRTLLHEYHDFFLASQHPAAKWAVRCLPSEYAMPARLWRHGIHPFLELLRLKLPESREHMFTFIYLAYSMVALLYETVPTFEKDWIECLGDIGRSRLEIKDDDTEDREIWTGTSRRWYSMASGMSPTIGRFYHHRAFLVSPNVLQQIFFYTKSFCVAEPCLSSQEGIMTLFKPLFEPDDAAPSEIAPIDAAFVRANVKLFILTRDNATSIPDGAKEQLKSSMDEFASSLDGHIAGTTKRWLESGQVKSSE